MPKGAAPALYLLVYTLVLVIEFVVMAARGATAHKSVHLVLVERHSTGVGVGIFVVIVMLTALTGGGVVDTVFRKIECHTVI